eukprot:7576288-Karenia_brevis.AAC.1
MRTLKSTALINLIDILDVLVHIRKLSNNSPQHDDPFYENCRNRMKMHQRSKRREKKNKLHQHVKPQKHTIPECAHMLHRIYSGLEPLPRQGSVNKIGRIQMRT